MKDNKQRLSVKLPAKASFWYLFISLTGKGVGFITTPMLTRLLDGEEYGKFTLYITLIGGISVICSAISSGSAVYKGLKDFSHQKEKYLQGVLLANSVFSLLICIVLFTFSDFFRLKPILFLPLTIQIVCDGIVAVALTSAKFCYKYKTVAALTLCCSALPPIISIIILKMRGGGYGVRVYALLFVSILAALYSLGRLIKGDKGVDKKTIMYVLRSSAPLLPHTVSTALSTQADKFIIGSVLGAAALGKYSVVFSLGVALQFIITSIGSALNPWIIRKLDADQTDVISNLIAPMFIGYSALALCVIAVGPEALLFLAPENYFDAFPALLPLALSCPFYFLSSVVTVGLVHSGKGKYSVLLSIISATLCVILNYALISMTGYFGAGAATLLCRVTEAIIGIYLLEKATGKSIISTKKILLPTIIVSAVGVAIYLAKNLLWARGILLLIPAAIIIYFLYGAKNLVLEKS